MAKKQSAAVASQPAKLSQTDLAYVVDEIESARQNWESSTGTDETINWNGIIVKPISTQLHTAFDQLIKLSLQPPEHFAPSAYETILEVDRFADELDRWINAAETRPETTNPSGSQQLWEAWRRIVKAATAQVAHRKPEPIKDLFERDGVSLQQIAKIYAWFNEFGAPDVQKVSEELANPGTHYDPTTWRHPSQVNHERQMAEKWAARRESKKNAIERESSQSSPAHSSAVAPEPLDDLIFQNVPKEQIAKMKRISVEEVEARAEELGLQLGSGRILTPEQQRNLELQTAKAKRNALRDAANSTTAPTPPAKFVQNKGDVKRSELYADDPIGQTIEASAREYQSMGMTPEDVLAMLKDEHPEVTITLADVQKWLSPVAV